MPEKNTDEEEKSPELVRANTILYDLTQATPFSKNRTTAKPKQDVSDYDSLVIEQFKQNRKERRQNNYGKISNLLRKSDMEQISQYGLEPWENNESDRSMGPNFALAKEEDKTIV